MSIYDISSVTNRWKTFTKIGPVTTLAAGLFMEGTGEILFGFIALFTEQ